MLVAHASIEFEYNIDLQNNKHKNFQNSFLLNSKLSIFRFWQRTLEAYSTELEIIAKKVFDFMGKALGMDPKDMKELLGEAWQAMRINYYPPCPQPELVIGLNPHSDGTGLTILLQINEMEGLQIKKDGIWVPVKPLPNAFIVNIGDMLEVNDQHFSKTYAFVDY